MAHLELLSEGASKNRQISQTEQHFVFSLSRLGYYTFLFGCFYLYNFAFYKFIDPMFYMGALTALSFGFFSSALNFGSKKVETQLSKNISILLALDAVFVCLFVFLSDIVATKVVFLYLVPIIFSGFFSDRHKTLFVTAVCCLLFNLNQTAFQLSDESVLLSLGLNNFAFLITGFLSGSLGKHIQEISGELITKKREVERFKNINSLIVNNISSGIVTVGADGTVLTFNSKAEEILGVFLKAMSFQDILQKADFAVSNSGRQEISIEVNDEKKIIEVISSPLKSGGKAEGVIYLLRDQTDQKKLEYAARQQEKMAAVGQLAAGIAHEIRNPLASISGSVQLLESTSDDPENAKLFKIIIKEIDRLNDLITEFLEFVKPEKVKETPLDLNNLISGMVSMVKMDPSIGENISIETELYSKKYIHADESKLKQALLNIAINGIQAMKNLRSGTLKISTYDNNDDVVLIISDGGEGIKPEILNKIFEPFLTTKAKGTGLGLAITHKILENHKAYVEVESQVGEGTKFIITFAGKGTLFPNEDKIKKIA